MANTMTSNRNQEDLQTMQHQIQEKKTSILDSTRRMLGLINESEVVGTNTAAVSLVIKYKTNKYTAKFSSQNIDIYLMSLNHKNQTTI